MKAAHAAHTSPVAGLSTELAAAPVQGLTLVHFSAQHKPFLWVRGYM